MIVFNRIDQTRRLNLMLFYDVKLSQKNDYKQQRALN